MMLSKKQALNVLLFCFSLAIVYFFLQKADIKLFMQHIRRAEWEYLVVVLLLNSVAYFFRALEWKMLEPKTHLGLNYVSVLATLFISLGIPMKAGEPVGALMVSKLSKVPYLSVLAAILVERVLLMGSLLTIMLFSLFYWSRRGMSLYLIQYRGVLTIGILSITFLLWFFREKIYQLTLWCFYRLPKVKNGIIDLVSALRAVTGKKGRFFVCVLVSYAFWGIILIVNYTLLSMMHISLTLMQILFVLSISILGDIFIMLPGSVSASVIFAYILMQFGYSYDHAIAYVTVGTLVINGIIIMLGLPSLWTVRILSLKRR